MCDEYMDKPSWPMDSLRCIGVWDVCVFDCIQIWRLCVLYSNAIGGCRYWYGRLCICCFIFAYFILLDMFCHFSRLGNLRTAHPATNNEHHQPLTLWPVAIPSHISHSLVTPWVHLTAISFSADTTLLYTAPRHGYVSPIFSTNTAFYV